MKIVGIIAEYNPLHNGHVYHIEQAKKLSGTDKCIVVMSGNFVQRGEPAVADKFQRAEWAVRAGADLVIELPSVYAVSSAERFALGGIRTLIGTGIVTHLSFGCEEPDIDRLLKMSDMLANETPEFKESLHYHLKQGKSYPRARYDALYDLGIPEEDLDIIDKPNNILAIEYLRALKLYAPDVVPVPVARDSCTYDQETLSGYLSSATAIRLALSENREEVLGTMPFFVGGKLFYDEDYPVSMQSFEKMILYRLRMMHPEDIARLPDVTEGFENLISDSVKNACSLNDLLDKIKSKRYTMSRCKRIMLSALLNITKSDLIHSIQNKAADYIHVLAVNQDSQNLISAMRKYGYAPVLMKKKDQYYCNEMIQRNVSADSLSTDIYSIATGAEIRRDYQGPLMVSLKSLNPEDAF